MSDDDPYVERVIRTPGTTVTLKGPLSQVDSVYRTCTQALLATGKYTIPKPGADPWQQYDPPAEDNVDHLRRRVLYLEGLLRDSEDHEAMRALRQQNAQLVIQENQWKQAFVDINDACVSARTSLSDDPEPNLYTAVALSFLSL